MAFLRSLTAGTQSALKNGPGCPDSLFDVTEPDDEEDAGEEQVANSPRERKLELTVTALLAFSARWVFTLPSTWPW
jgi:hypothetical protein